MRNLKLTIEYNGTNYCGWQVQTKEKTKPSIQETIQKSLHKILHEKVNLIASGRTDSGVHAFGQVANFKTKSKIPLEKLQKGLNSLLPSDISILKIEEVPLGFHSRFDAKSKVYRYLILDSKCPPVFLRDLVYKWKYDLDVKLMRKEASCLLGRHDFKGFCASGSGAKTTIRTIKKISIKRFKSELLAGNGNPIAIEIEADGFLYNMVRNIVGTLLEIGRGRFKKETVKKILDSKNRRIAGPTAPAQGLTLLKVDY